MVVGWVSLLTLFRLNGKARKLGKGYSSMVEQELSLAQRRLWIPPSVQPSSELSKIERLQGSFDEMQEDGATEPDSVSTQNGSNRSHEHAISGHGISRPSTSAYAGSHLGGLCESKSGWWEVCLATACVSEREKEKEGGGVLHPHSPWFQPTLNFFFFSFFFVYVVLAGLKPTEICLPLSCRCWKRRHAPPKPDWIFFLMLSCCVVF